MNVAFLEEQALKLKKLIPIDTKLAVNFEGCADCENWDILKNAAEQILCSFEDGESVYMK